MDKNLHSDEIDNFRKSIWEYYRKNARSLPWRHTDNPYHILVSEIMLQQTQVERVVEKYRLFLSAFPDFHSLARAPLRSVLSVWQGLGYNRRAVALQRIAQEVIMTFNGTLPFSENMLVKLPGIGKATASAIAAFAYNKPVVFLETNIRRVFIHFFFAGKNKVKDTEILPLVAKTLDFSDPRQWFYALMDYGAMLKGKIQNPNRKSAHYQKQAPFQGSNRQLRGMVLKEIVAEHRVTESALRKKLHVSPEKIREIFLQLQKEGFIKKRGNGFFIA